MTRLLQILIIILMIVLVVPIILYIVAALFFTWRSKMDPRQKLFENGKVPNPELDGAYKGSAGVQWIWRGKSFNKAENSGINNFEMNGKIEQHFTFKTWVGKGIYDKELEVLKIDYNIPQNPFYCRFILDELVELEPGKYLGKAHNIFIPIIPFTIIYFKLEK